MRERIHPTFPLH
jgi:hypothetical protein